MKSEMRSEPVRNKSVVALLAMMSLTAAVCQYSPASAAAGPATPTSATSAVAGAAGGASVNRPRVIILATGGTIAGQADPRAANAYNAGNVSAQQLIQSVPGIDKLADLRAEQIASIGSSAFSRFTMSSLRLARFTARYSDMSLQTGPSGV